MYAWVKSRELAVLQDVGQPAVVVQALLELFRGLGDCNLPLHACAPFRADRSASRSIPEMSRCSWSSASLPPSFEVGLQVGFHARVVACGDVRGLDSRASPFRQAARLAGPPAVLWWGNL